MFVYLFVFTLILSNSSVWNRTVEKLNISINFIHQKIWNIMVLKKCDLHEHCRNVILTFHFTFNVILYKFARCWSCKSEHNCQMICWNKIRKQNIQFFLVKVIVYFATSQSKPYYQFVSINKNWNET